MAAKPRRGGTIGRGPLGTAARSIAEQRLRIGLTQRELADLSEVSDLTVRMIEQGQPGVRIESLVRVLDALGLSLVVAPRPVAAAMAQSGKGVLLTEDAPAGRGTA